MYAANQLLVLQQYVNVTCICLSFLLFYFNKLDISYEDCMIYTPSDIVSGQPKYQAG